MGKDASEGEEGEGVITSDGWLSWAERVPGPAEKVYSEANAAIGYVPHSMVGQLQGWYSRLFDMTRDADGQFTKMAAASVHGSILRGGQVIQHYPFIASCWASGSRYPNTRFIAFENESVYRDGKPDESIPLTGPQIEANVRIIRELSQWSQWIPRRPVNAADLTASLYEHRECVRFGSAATACPSGRIPWARIIEELTMKVLTPEEALKFNAQVAFHLNDSRDLGKIATVVQYIYRVKGWPWPAA
jgi:hypothetical protein